MIAGKKGQFFTLGQLGDLQAAIEAYDEVLRRFGDSPEPALREQVAKARRLRDKLAEGTG